MFTQVKQNTICSLEKRSFSAVLRIRDVYPGSRILILSIPDRGSRIPDPKTATKERGEKRIVFILFCSTNITKLKTILFLNLGQFIKNCRTFLPEKFSLSSQKYRFGISYPGSGKKPIPYPGSRIWGQKGTGSRILIRNTAFRLKLEWIQLLHFLKSAKDLDFIFFPFFAVVQRIKFLFWWETF
jgi:hypothetical protein